MPNSNIARFLLLPELEITHVRHSHGLCIYKAVKTRSHCEICPKCAKPAKTVYDHRSVKVQDEPLRRAKVILEIKKRRFWCKHCKKPFTEPIQGVLPKKRTTQRLQRAITQACENFSDLKKVRQFYKVSNNYIYRALYSQLELNRRKLRYPWPKTIGIDEHFFSRRGGRREFATVVTDMKNKRLRAVCKGKGPRLFA